jgi:hypothetical protein
MSIDERRLYRDVHYMFQVISDSGVVLGTYHFHSGWKFIHKVLNNETETFRDTAKVLSKDALPKVDKVVRPVYITFDSAGVMQIVPDVELREEMLGKTSYDIVPKLNFIDPNTNTEESVNDVEGMDIYNFFCRELTYTTLIERWAWFLLRKAELRLECSGIDYDIDQWFWKPSMKKPMSRDLYFAKKVCPDLINEKTRLELIGL